MSKSKMPVSKKLILYNASFMIARQKKIKKKVQTNSTNLYYIGSSLKVFIFNDLTRELHEYKLAWNRLREQRNNRGAVFVRHEVFFLSRPTAPSSPT